MSNPIRILNVFSLLDRGGAESMCMNLYRHIDRSKVQFDFVKHSQKPCDFDKEIESLGGRIYIAPRFNGLNLIRYCNWWKKHLEQHPEHQIIHGHFFTVSALYFSVCKKYNRITIAHSHGTKPPYAARSHKIKSWISDRLVAKIEYYSDRCFACSKDAGAWVFPTKPFVVLHNAIDTEKFRFNKIVAEDVKRELNISKSFVVGAVGRFNLQKNPLGIVEIFSCIHNIRPDSKLLWIGDGPMKVDAMQRIKELKLENNVLFLGVRSDVDRLMQAMDVFIFPSFYEGLGIVAIEAQAAGLPCYCSDVIPHEVGVTDLCKFLPLDCPECWAEEIISNQSIRRNTTNELVRSGYDIRDTATWLEHYYCTLSNSAN